MNKEKNSKIAFVHFLYKYTLLGVRQQLVVTTDDLQKKNLNPVAAPDM